MSNATALLSDESGFAVYGLRTPSTEIHVAPELGAKIISLKNLETGREWMWRPPGPFRLFRNEPGDPFERSTLTGADECLPTVAPCKWEGRELPDHGELWSIPWTVDRHAWDQGRIKTTVATPISPFLVERTIRLEENEIILDYRLRNVSRRPEPFLWAFHPLLEIVEGDRIALPEEVRSVRVESADGLQGTLHRNPRPWPEPFPGVNLSRMDFGPHGPACAKLFVESPGVARAAIVNSHTGDSLVLRIDVRQNPALGIWITRGGWHGYEHAALEPTNGASDSLAEAASEGTSALVLPPEEVRAWTIRLCLQSLRPAGG
jgi:galactose mutarotase-like enzyme